MNAIDMAGQVKILIGRVADAEAQREVLYKAGYLAAGGTPRKAGGSWKRAKYVSHPLEVGPDLPGAILSLEGTMREDNMKLRGNTEVLLIQISDAERRQRNAELTLAQTQDSMEELREEFKEMSQKHAIELANVNNRLLQALAAVGQYAMDYNRLVAETKAKEASNG